MFKRIFLAATIAILAVPLAHADTKTTGRYGAWKTFAGTASDSGKPLCGAGIEGGDRLLDIQYSGQALYIHLLKKGWDIPQGTKIKLVMQIDDTPAWNLDAVGYRTPNNSYIEFNFDNDEVAPSGEKFVRVFTNLLRSGLNIRFKFPGSEPDWTGSLNGANAALNALGMCMKVLDADAAPSTQPFTTATPVETPAVKATQPF